jgi:hypothetical protein
MINDSKLRQRQLRCKNKTGIYYQTLHFQTAKENLITLYKPTHLQRVPPYRSGNMIIGSRPTMPSKAAVRGGRGGAICSPSLILAVRIGSMVFHVWHNVTTWKP